MMKSRMAKLLGYGCVVSALSVATLLLLFTKHSESAAKKYDSVPECANRGPSATDDEVENYLGKGAWTDWQSGQLEAMREGEAGETSTVVVYGADEGDIQAEVRSTAAIGPLHKEVFHDTVYVPRSASVPVPIKLDAGVDLHEKQKEYTTKIFGSVRSVHLESSEHYHQLLSLRFVAYNEDSRGYEVMDQETRDRLHPYGFTTPEGQAMVREILANVPPGEMIEDIGPGIALEGTVEARDMGGE